MEIVSKVSVLVPSFNYGRYLPLTLRSILSQSHSDLELIITDDCSSDESRAIAEEYRRLDSRVRAVFHDSNRGLAASRNSALAISSGEFVAFCDADDIWLPDKLKIQLEYLRNRPEVGLTHSDALIMDRDGNLTGQLFSALMHRKRQATSGNLFEELCQRNFFCVPTVVVRRQAIMRIGGFAESLRSLEDWVCWAKISRHYPIHYTSDALAKYRVHPASLSADSRTMCQYRTRASALILTELTDIPPRIRSKILYTLGMSHLALGHHNEAKEAFWNSISANTRELRSWLRLAQASYKAERLPNIQKAPR